MAKMAISHFITQVHSGGPIVIHTLYTSDGVVVKSLTKRLPCDPETSLDMHLVRMTRQGLLQATGWWLAEQTLPF